MESLGHPRDAVPEGTRVLCVGDDPDVARSVETGLEGTDSLELASATTATEALDALEGGSVACIVSAASLPDVDVLTLLEGVREISSDVPFVVVSETDDPDLASAVLSYEATDFLHWRGEAHQREQLARRVRNEVSCYRAKRTAEWTTAYFDALVHQAPDAILTVDGSGEIVFANRAVEEIFGYTPEQLVGESLTELIPERMRQAHEEAFDRYQRTGVRTLDWDYVELPGRHREGHEVPLVLSFRELDFGDRRLFSAVVRDVTERKHAEDELKSEKEFTEGALNALPDLFFTLDLQGRLVRWNDEVESVTGYDAEELALRDPIEFFPDDEQDRIAEVVERVFAEGQARVEAPLERADGEEAPYEFTGALLEDDDGDPLGIAGIGRDITERKEREAELEASREKFQKLVETAPDAVFIADAETGTVVDTNRAAERLLGKSREEIVGMHQSELHPPEEADRYRRLFEEHVESGGVVQEDDDYYAVHDDGHRVPVEISAGITEIGGRKLNQAIFRNITDRKQREETLATLREVTRDLMSAESKRDICDIAVRTARDILDLPISGIHLYDEDERALRPAAATEEGRELFDGVPTFEEGEGLAWQVFTSEEPELYESLPERTDAYNPETPIQTEMILPLGDHGILTSGSTESERITGAKLNLAKILAANTEAALDRADREQTIERQRDQLQAELDEVFERIDDGFFALDDEWRFAYVNERAERLLGGSEDELFGQVVWEVFPEIRDADAREAFFEAVETQDPVSHEEYVEALGAWFEFRVYPSESGLSVYLRDISGRKEREQRLERQNQRLESFASMLAHELRNPLSIAQIYLTMAEGGDESAFEQVESALDRMEDMIDVLLVMTRGGEAAIDPEAVSLRETATEAWSNVTADADCLEVETDLRVEAEPNHLQHLLENLFANAVEHSVDERTSESPDDVTVRVGSLDEGFYVADDGPGIPEDDREQVFEAGYTTDDGGIGLGLTFIEQLAEIYEWECRLTESDDGGARFEFEQVDFVETAE